MRVLIVTFTFPPNLDGVSMAAAAMARACLKRGWHVDVFTEQLRDQPRPANWEGATIIEYIHDKQQNSILQADDMSPFNTFLTTGKWDVIVFHSYHQLLECAMPIIGQVKAGKVLISHGYGGFIWERNPRFPWGLGAVVRRCLKGFIIAAKLRRFERVVFLSEHSDFKGFFDHSMARLWTHPERRVVPNGIDPDIRATDGSEFRKRHGIADDEFMFLCVANYSSRKDQGYAAMAFRMAAIPNSRLVFIGSELNEHSEKFQAQERAIAEPGHEEDVCWLEKLGREETLNAFAACDAFVLSAKHEALPISLLEAMRESKPWIARRSGCIHLMEGGLCVNSLHEMECAMKRIISEPDLAACLGSEGRQAIQNRYNSSITDAEHCTILEEAASVWMKVNNTG